MHIVCNALRVFLGVLVVALVGKHKYILTSWKAWKSWNQMMKVDGEGGDKDGCEDGEGHSKAESSM